MIHRCFVVSAVIEVGFLAGCGGEDPAAAPLPRPVKAMKVSDISAFTERSFPGQAEATEEVDLGFEVGGIVARRLVDRGKSVQADQLLARLDPADYQNAYEAALAERDRARANRDRIKIAAASGAVSQQDVDDAEALLSVREAEVKIRAKAVEDTKIIAPYDGVIAETYVENYQRVLAKQKVLRLLDISKVEMTVDIPESLISLTSYVTELQCSFDAFPGRKIPAKFKYVGTQASTTTRTYPVTVIMDQPGDVTILPGMAGTVTGRGVLPEDLDASGVEIPLSAVFSDKEEKKFVWVIDETEQIVSRREVALGDTTGVGVRVKGIAPGEWIATAGAYTLKDGQKVRILQ